jgi:ABC-2 type transport system permease protein
MRTIRFLLQKEFRQIFRNRTILAMILFMPVVQLIILPLAADYEVKNINLAVVDHDHSPAASRLISKITSSGYFKLVEYTSSYKLAFELIEKDRADLILELPAHFEKQLYKENKQQIFIAVNAINGTKANLGGAYLASVIRDFNTDLVAETYTPDRSSRLQQVEVVSNNWYNRFLNYRVFMVPGILAILVTMIGGFLAALNIVKEKEVGTIEQINVTPIKKHHFILGKLIPFWVLGNVVFSLGLLVSYLFYGIVPLGSLFTLYGFVAVFLMAILGFGLLISTFCETQQQAMFIMFFFMMIFILMGGLFTPTDGMPQWALWISRLNPVTYLITVMRMVVLRGSSMTDVLPHLGIVFCFALVLNTWAVLNYRKTSA